MYKLINSIFRTTSYFFRDMLIFILIFSIIGCGTIGYLYDFGMDYKNEVLQEYNISNYTYQPALKTEIYSRDGVLLAEIYNEKRSYIPYSEMPEMLVNAMVSVEDRRFYSHNGVDLFGIGRAFFKNIASGNLKGQGASTITQQITRELFLSQERTFERKIKEIFIAMELEKKYDKHEILEMYLNEVYFGHGAYGIEEAAQTYFAKSTKDLTTAEISLLVGLPQSPSGYDPYYHMDKAKNRQSGVLASMVRDGLITQEEADEIFAQEIVLNNSNAGKNSRYYKHPYFTSWVISKLENQYGDKIYSAGWKIYTTIDSEIQTKAEQIIKEDAKNFSTSINARDIALATVNPTTGELMLMVGGADFEKNQINMAVRPRQPGSSMKPYVYATGIDLGKITDSTLFLDEEIDINGYAPQNYDHSHLGWITTRTALMKSNNIAAVKAANIIGTKNIQTYAKNLGITTLTTQDYGLSMAIGGLYKGISPLEQATAYGAFANGGNLIPTYYISKITDRFGTTLYKASPKSHRVLKQETADSMADMLLSVVDSGTGGSAQISGYQVAGKTGTTDDARDLWFVGFTKNASTAVWVGNTDNEKLYRGASSGTNSGRVWKKVMTEYLKKYPPEGTFKRYPTSAYTLLLPRQDSEDAEPYLAGSNCSTTTELDYIVKTLYLRPEYAPTTVKSCSGERLPAEEIVSRVQNGTLSLQTAAETGYIRALVMAGYEADLRELGYGEEIDRLLLSPPETTSTTEKLPDGTEITTSPIQVQTETQESPVEIPSGLVHGTIGGDEEEIPSLAN